MQDVSVAIGRMNPITKGHELVIQKLLEHSRDYHSVPVVIIIEGVESSKDKLKNPLTGDERIHFINEIFPGLKAISFPNAAEAFKQLKENDYNVISLITGSDRDYSTLLKTYNHSRGITILEDNNDKIYVVNNPRTLDRNEWRYSDGVFSLNEPLEFDVSVSFVNDITEDSVRKRGKQYQTDFNVVMENIDQVNVIRSSKVLVKEENYTITNGKIRFVTDSYGPCFIGILPEITIIERKEDLDTLAGISATKMRNAAINEDYEKFRSYAPTVATESVITFMYQAVRNALGNIHAS